MMICKLMKKIDSKLFVSFPDLLRKREKFQVFFVRFCKLFPILMDIRIEDKLVVLLWINYSIYPMMMKEGEGKDVDGGQGNLMHSNPCCCCC